MVRLRTLIGWMYNRFLTDSCRCDALRMLFDRLSSSLAFLRRLRRLLRLPRPSARPRGLDC